MVKGSKKSTANQ